MRNFHLFLVVLVLASCSGPKKKAGGKTGGDKPGTPAAVSITIAPASAQIGEQGVAAFAATVAGAGDTSVKWSVKEGAAGGTVDGGTYTAPAAAFGTFHVIASANAEPAKTAVATVEVLKALISSVSAPGGAAGSVITINGNYFGGLQSGSQVTLDGDAVAITGWSNTAISFTVPGNKPAGTYSLAVQIGSQTALTQSFAVRPGIASLSVTTATTGQSVTAVGTNFGATQLTSTISVGGASATVSSWADTTATFAIPMATAGGAQPVVITVSGQAGAPHGITVVTLPSIASLSLTSAATGTPITLTGFHFGAAKGASQVWFGDLTATTTAWTGTSITAVVPTALMPATAPVFVSVAGKYSNRISFVPLRPWIESRTPTIGTSGTTITLHGRNFGSAQGSVSIGGVAATSILNWFPSAVTLQVPGSVPKGRQYVILSDSTSRQANAISFYQTGNDMWVLPETPLERWAHFSVWTGNEMIIWGGMADYWSALQSGSRYNPATDTWLPMTMTNAPSPRITNKGDTWSRVNAPAVWTGQEMMIWGGYSSTNGGSHLTTGGRYNPATDTWAAMSNLNAPSARDNFAGVWSGSEFIIWGGDNPSDSYPINNGARYDPAADTWTAMNTANAPSGRSDVSAVWTGTEMITWANRSYGADDVGGRYNPLTDTWVRLPNYDPFLYRRLASSAWTGQYFIIWGGVYSSADYNTGARYDPQTNAWSAISTTGAPAARQHAIAVMAGSKMLIWGGLTNASALLNDGGQYDPALDSWSSVTSSGAPAGRENLTAVYTGQEMITWGGKTGSYACTCGGRYNPAANTWTLMGSSGVPAMRQNFSSVWTGSEMIVWGGQTSGGNLGSQTGARYNPTLDSWTPTSTVSAPLSRYNHSAVWVGTEMMVWGGWYSPDGSILQQQNTGGQYTPVTDTWIATSTTGNVATARLNPVMVWTGTEVLIWGNAKNGGDGRYYPAANTWSTYIAIPAGDNSFTARSGFNAIWTGTKMIIYGGIDSVLNSGTAALSSYVYTEATASWTQYTYLVANAPVSRGHASAVWTGTEMIVWGGDRVTFNGSWYTDIRNDGGRYNPTSNTWSAGGLSTTNALSARKNAHAGYYNGKMYVWGGTDVNDNPLTDGAIYNVSGDSWSAMSSANQPDVLYSQLDVWATDKMIVWPGGMYLP